MALYITNLYVEFLQQGGLKPYVIFRLKIQQPVSVGPKTYWGCWLAMDTISGTDGEFQITPIMYNDISRSAHALFEFKVKDLN